MKKSLSLILPLILLLGLCACGSSNETAVYVQSVEHLSHMGGIAPGDRFAGVVVAENVTEIFKDQDKAVHTLLVKEGQDVEAGQELFNYDTDQLQLDLDRKNLELDQLKATIEKKDKEYDQMMEYLRFIRECFFIYQNAFVDIKSAVLRSKNGSKCEDSVINAIIDEAEKKYEESEKRFKEARAKWDK